MQTPDQINLSPAEIASRFINHSNKNVFLTGKAGTGKTTFLRDIVSSTHKKAVIVAPTGIAAINAGGATIHSFFQIPPSCFIPENSSPQNFPPNIVFTTPNSLMYKMRMGAARQKLIRELELLIIDEVSMLRADLLDMIDQRLKQVRRKSHLAFGGVQVLFIGDLLQLPPVVKNEEREILSRYYNSAFFFEARALKQNKPVYVELDKIYRQKDERFVSLLNNLRNNILTAEDVALLNKYYKPGYVPSEEERIITLTTHNNKAAEINLSKLSALPAKSKTFKATISSDFPEYSYPAEEKLELKIGAQVMFVKNDPTGAQRFFNGKTGTVVEFIFDSEKKKELIRVKCEGEKFPVEVDRFEWRNVKYELNSASNEIEEKTAGTFKQFPLRLAWAITVHKSQGLTFDKAIIDIGQAFAPGQVYVALSRLRSLDGLVLTSKINTRGLLADENVLKFSQSKELQGDLNQQVKEEARIFLLQYLQVCFDLKALVQNFAEHEAGYIANEKRSVKAKNAAWMKEVYAMISRLLPHAEKFIAQLNEIFSSHEKDFASFLYERVGAAEKYFGEALSAIADNILERARHINQTEKRVKEYLEELLELELMVFEQQKKMKKGLLMTNAFLHEKEFSKADLNNLVDEKVRDEKLRKVLYKGKHLIDEEEMDEELEKEIAYRDVMKRGEGYAHKYLEADLELREEEILVRQRKFVTNKKFGRSSKEAKPKKKPTREISFEMYKAGKTVEEIAKERNFVVSTIESHLVPFIQSGEIDAEMFITREKIDHIVRVATEMQTGKLTEIKEKLGEEYSYMDIKVALAMGKIE